MVPILSICMKEWRKKQLLKEYNFLSNSFWSKHFFDLIKALCSSPSQRSLCQQSSSLSNCPVNGIHWKHILPIIRRLTVAAARRLDPLALTPNNLNIFQNIIRFLVVLCLSLRISIYLGISATRERRLGEAKERRDLQISKQATTTDRPMDIDGWRSTHKISKFNGKVLKRRWRGRRLLLPATGWLLSSFRFAWWVCNVSERLTEKPSTLTRVQAGLNFSSPDAMMSATENID